MLRGLEILEVLAGLEQPATLVRIAARAGYNEAAAYRTLRRLEEQGYVDHVPRSGYRLGSRSVALAVLVGPEPPLLRAAHRVLTRLVTITGHSAAMHLRSGTHRILTAGVPAPSHPLRDEAAIGERAPLTSGSAGLTILAHLPDSEAEAVTATRPAEERRPAPEELARIREDGFLVGERRSNASMRGISAPLLDPASGAPLGSLTIAALGDQTTQTMLMSYVPVLLRACADLGPQLSALLGPSSARGRRGRDVAVSRQEPADQE
ncbi:helix-turn-helix domain-containing protein [Streptomyces sp. NPDC049954]|uniref:IclR family transcriptional regulator n=1 Tax=Streptomyces sp. NPDC049954 TaxID=3155779 RepID=UPI0034395F1C